MKKMASTETAGCRIDAGQDGKPETVAQRSVSHPTVEEEGEHADSQSSLQFPLEGCDTRNAFLAYVGHEYGVLTCPV